LERGEGAAMKILMLVQYFDLPQEPGGSRAYQFARRWCAQGHQVTVLAGNVNYKTGRIFPCSPGRAYSVENHPDGFRLYRLWTYSRFRGSFRKRLLFFGSYALHAGLLGPFLPRPDLVFASSTPLTVGLPGEFLSRLFRVPFVFELRDLWPEAAVAAGVMSNPAWIRRTQALACRLYRRADALIALTEGIRDGIVGHGVPPEKVTLAPNGVDDWMEPERFRTPEVIPKSDGALTCLYVGAHGLWNNLETLLAAARTLKEDARVRFLFIGDGDRLEALTEQARAEGLERVRFLGAWPKDRAFAAMVQADLGLIAASAHPHNRQTLPNKIFDYMAAGIPVLVAAGEGEMADLLRRSGGGWTSPPEDGALLAQAILRAHGLGVEERARMGEAGRQYVQQHFSRPRMADEILEIFQRLRAKGTEEAPGSREEGNVA
jgi:glycosyltransferase involved in cell wall biosynthesis